MALHVPRGIYTIVVSIRLDYCRRDCATSPSWSPAMSYEENYREQPRGKGHVMSAGLDACVAHSASGHRDPLACAHQLRPHRPRNGRVAAERRVVDGPLLTRHPLAARLLN